ncbi:MAG: Heme A synthase [Phycisphaerales bacterium]|nr:Heme A synthase [Phycisphaerales bacterium]
MTTQRLHLDGVDATKPIRSGPILVYGFGTAVAMWCAWLLTHIPGVDLSPPIVGGVLLAVLAAGMVFAGWSLARGGAPRLGWIVGAGAGTLAAAINLLVLASYLVEQARPGTKPAEGFEGLTPAAAIYIPGFLLAGAVIGALGGLIGSVVGKSPPPPDGNYAGHGRWLARLSLVSTVAALPLIILGGFVTSTASGMAVPGWPDSYGANMFLFPVSLMSHPRVFLEHSHRLFGAMVGLSVLALMIYTLRVEKRRWVRGWMIVLFVAVCVQGVLGGLRVVQNSTALATVHGILAQLFFAALAAGTTYLTLGYRTLKASPPVTSLPPDEVRHPRKRRIVVVALFHLLIVQLIMGAWYRHTGQNHPLYTHVALAVVIVILGFIGGMMLRWTRDLPDPAARLSRRLGTGLLGCILLQFGLGWLVLGLVFTGTVKEAAPLAHEMDSKPPPPRSQVLAATVHQANGALIIAFAAAGTVLARGASRRKPVEQP